MVGAATPGAPALRHGSRRPPSVRRSGSARARSRSTSRPARHGDRRGRSRIATRGAGAMRPHRFLAQSFPAQGDAPRDVKSIVVPSWCSEWPGRALRPSAWCRPATATQYAERLRLFGVGTVRRLDGQLRAGRASRSRHGAQVVDHDRADEVATIESCLRRVDEVRRHVAGTKRRRRVQDDGVPLSPRIGAARGIGEGTSGQMQLLRHD